MPQQKNSQSTSPGVTSGGATSTRAQEDPRMVCATATLRACRGKRVIPMSTQYLNDSAEAKEVLRQGRQINVNGG